MSLGENSILLTRANTQSAKEGLRHPIFADFDLLVFGFWYVASSGLFYQKHHFATISGKAFNATRLSFVGKLLEHIVLKTS